MTDTQSPQAGSAADRPSRIPWPPILLLGAIVAALTLGGLAPLGWPGLDDTPARMVGLAIGAPSGITLNPRGDAAIQGTLGRRWSSRPAVSVFAPPPSSTQP